MFFGLFIQEKEHHSNISHTCLERFILEGQHKALQSIHIQIWFYQKKVLYEQPGIIALSGFRIVSRFIQKYQIWLLFLHQNYQPSRTPKYMLSLGQAKKNSSYKGLTKVLRKAQLLKHMD